MASARCRRASRQGRLCADYDRRPRQRRALTILVLMHSGKGTGVSDMIASSLYNSSSATGVMEQNLDRLTVIMAVVFAVCVVLCMFFFPQGIVGY